MHTPLRMLATLATALAAQLALGALLATDAAAQDRPFWDRSDSYGDRPRTVQAPTRPRRDDAWRPPAESYDGPPGGFGRQAVPDGRPPADGYGSPPPPLYTPPAPGPGGYAQSPSYDPRYDQPAQSAPPYGSNAPPYGAPPQPYGAGPPPRDDAYRPPARGGYSDNNQWGSDRPYGTRNDGGYGQPYTPPPDQPYAQDGRPPPHGDRRWDEQRGPRTYSQNEVLDSGHRFFGSISQGLARAVERLFQSQGRPNGYILGEDAGGAFVAGLRYGEGLLYTKDAGNHRVFWQGPSLGYDFGGEGSKAMVLVYNLRDPSDIYERFGGVQGAAYVIGGVSVQFQTHGHVTLAVIRSGVGLRLGANVGYLKYTRRPTWNPF